MTWLIILVGAFVILRLIKPLVVLNQLLRQRFWRVGWRVATEEEVPAWTRDGFGAPMAELEALGFQRIGWVAFEREGVVGDAPRFYARLGHPEACAQAM